MTTREEIGKTIAILIIAGALPATACAQLAQNLTIGNAKALALGNAVTADPPGVDSIHFNPAGLARINGREIQWKYVAADIALKGKFSSNEDYDRLLEERDEEDPLANTSSEIEGAAFYMPGKGIKKLPVAVGLAGGIAYSPPGSRWVLGTAVYTPVVGGFTRDEKDPGTVYGRQAAVTRITYFSPTIAYRFSDDLSVGAGLGFSYFGIGLKIDFRAPNPVLGRLEDWVDDICAGNEALIVNGEPFTNLCEGAVNPFEPLLTLDAGVETYFSQTFNFGVLWQAFPWLSLGTLYQSESKDTLRGELVFGINDGLLEFVQGVGDSRPELGATVNRLGLSKYIVTDGEIEVTMPAHFALGASLQITPRAKFNVDWKWSDVSVWNQLDVVIDKKVPLLGLIDFLGFSNVTENSLIIPRGYKDASNFAFGAEYQYNDQVSLRMGYEPRKSGIPDHKLDFLIPIGDFDMYSIGFSFQPDRHTEYDVALAYANIKQYIPAGSSTNGNYTSDDNLLYNPTAGMDVTSNLKARMLEVTYQKRM